MCKVIFQSSVTYSPVSSPHAITIGGTAKDNGLYKTLFTGSNYGKCVDLYAPAQSVTAAGIHGYR